MSQTQPPTHRLLHDLFNAREFEATRAHAAAGFTYTDCGSVATYDSIDRFIDTFMAGWVAGFSDARVDVEGAEYIAGDHVSVCQFRATGTHDGTFAGVPATGRSINTPFCEVLHLDDDGKATDGRIYYDRLTIMEQLGVAGPAGVPAQRDLVGTHRALNQLFNRRDWDGMRPFLADSLRYVDVATGRASRGVEEFLEQQRGSVQGISDGRAVDDRYLQGRDFTVSLFVGTGTHDGTTREGIPATGRSISADFCEILHYDQHGKVVSGELRYDQLTVLQQLGVVELPAELRPPSVPRPSEPAASETRTATTTTD